MSIGAHIATSERAGEPASRRVDVLWTPTRGAAGGFAALLDAAERARQGRLRQAADRAAFAAAHGLARLSLSRLDGAVDPRDWRLTGGGTRKPALAPPGAGVDLSLTHTDGLAAAAAARGALIGVDAEPLDRDIDPDALAADALAASERARLAALAPAARRRMFLRLWTLKEAYAKAIGRGLAHPFATCAFSVEDRPVVDAVLAGAGAGWRFRQWIVDERWVVAVAARADAGAGPEFDLLRIEAPHSTDQAL